MMKSFLAFVVISFFCITQGFEAGTSEALFSVPINIDGTTQDLSLFQGQTVEMAAASFIEKHGIHLNKDEPEVQNILLQLSRALQDQVNLSNKPQPILSVPFTVNGESATIEVYDGQTINQAINDFMVRNQINEDIRAELHPQLVQLVAERANEQRQTSPAVQPEFFVTVNLDSQDLSVPHFKNQDPMEEVREFLLAYGIQSEETLNKLVPQIAAVVQKKIDERQSPVISVPIVIDGQDAFISYQIGESLVNSAIKFLQEQGVTNTAVIESYVPQIVEVIQNHVNELNAQQQQTKEPLVSVPLMIGQKAVTMEYFEGDNVEATVTNFMILNGLREDPGAGEYVKQLMNLIDERVAGIMAQRKQEKSKPPATTSQKVTEKQLLFSMDINLGNDQTVTLPFYNNDQAGNVAKKFCLDNGVSVDNIPKIIQALENEIAKL